MYHPQVNEAQNEWVELYNENSCRVDLGGWAFAEGIDFVFPEGTVLDPGGYLVLARDPAHIAATYGITDVMGPFTGQLDNSSDRIVLFDNAGGIMAEVDYEDSGKWPVAADGAGHSLAKRFALRDPLDPDNWSASQRIGGTPGRDNGLESRWEDTEVIRWNDTWRYFKGLSEASSPRSAWRQIAFNDTGTSWILGATGIGFADSDDQTVLSDMQSRYKSIFCRRRFILSNPADVDRLILSVDYDDGFVAYLNGVEVVRASMPSGTIGYNTNAYSHEAGKPEEFDISRFKSVLATTNVLAIQVHNSSLGDGDFSFIPRLVRRKIHQPAAVETPVVINEVHFRTSGTQYIELYNRSATPASVGGWYLSNDPDRLNLFQIPSPLTIAGHGHAVFLQSALGFAIQSGGDRILFTSPSLNAVVDARAVEPGPVDRTEGRWPDGAESWFYMNPTTGTANAAALTTGVVINEIMYHPPSDDDRDEYVELHNAGLTSVSLAGWRFSRGISYDFPTTAVLEPGRYLVVAKDRTRLIARYGLDPAVVLGNFTGALADDGENVRLRDAHNNTADEVRYYDGGHWSEFADGYGSSLELMNPHQDNANHQAWAPSDERARAQWTFFSYAGFVSPAADVHEHEVHLHLMESGIALIDDIRLTTNSIDYIPNGGFESGTGNWTIMGNHVRSHVTTEDAHAGSRCLKIIASGGGDTGANHIEQDAAIPMIAGMYQLSFWAKWQYGNPILVTRCWNNQMPETHRLPIPAVTGTPGTTNSVHRADLGPVFSEVRHEPVIPTTGTSVLVRARLHDSDGVSWAAVYFKGDSDPGYASAPMRDDGLAGDAAAGDGVFAGVIPARAVRQTVAFYLVGADARGTTHSWPSDLSRPALYRVDAGPWSSRYPTYRVVMTAEREADLFHYPHLSDEPRNCTFIFNETDVYYNCGVRFIGSPAHRHEGASPGYTGYKVLFNADEKLNGVQWNARFDKLSNAGYRERLTYHLLSKMGQPSCQFSWRDVRLNARAEGMHEELLFPSRRFLETFYPNDSNGRLFELCPRFWFTSDDDTSLSTYVRDFLTWLYWGPDKDPYRWYYQIRNHDREDDYTSLIAMVEIFSRIPTATTETEVAAVVDVMQWLKMIAVRTVNSNGDFDGRKNAYIYRPDLTGRWQMLAWDCESGFQGPTLNLWTSLEPQVERFLRFGANDHHYMNLIHEYLATCFTHAYLDPWIDHYYSVAGGFPPDSCKTFITSRRNYVLSQLAAYLPPAVNPSVTSPNPLALAGTTAVLTGVAPINVRWVRCLGRDYLLDWSNATTWRLMLDIPWGVNSILLEFLDCNKQPVGTVSVTLLRPVLGADRWMKYQ